MMHQLEISKKEYSEMNRTEDSIFKATLIIVNEVRLVQVVFLLYKSLGPWKRKECFV